MLIVKTCIARIPTMLQTDDYATNILGILDNNIKTVTMRRNKTKARAKVVPVWGDEIKPFL